MIGVAKSGWTLDQLKERAQDSVEQGSGMHGGFVKLGSGMHGRRARGGGERKYSVDFVKMPAAIASRGDRRPAAR